MGIAITVAKKDCRMHIRPKTLIVVALVTCSIGPAWLLAADWPMLGRDNTRNAVSPESRAPVDWDIGKIDRKTGKWISDEARNVKWTARLGSQTFGTPVISGGQIFIGTNNGAGYLQRYPNRVDLGCLLCFRETDGQFLWQYSAEKHPGGRTHDWPIQGLGASPLVEGDRMWFVSNRYVLVCLDTQGFRDGENDGPYVDEPVTAPNEADVVWQLDLIKELGVFPHNAGMGPNRRCSPAASYENRIYVVTGNGVDESHVRIPAPEAPSLVCVDKDTGKVLWTDASPGANVLHSQVADPLVVEIGGRGQVIVPQGDGWIRSFDALTGQLIWKFDINPKESKWVPHGRATRNNILATPVFYKGRVYVGSGQEAEHGEGLGRLVCIDPTKTGDVSSELAVDAQGHPIPHRRVQAVDPSQGEKAVPNPNSGLIWEYTRFDHNGDGAIGFEEEFHRTVSSVAIRNDLLIAVDFSGLVHCLNAQTGRRHWVYDTFASIWTSSPLIVGQLVYVADEDGDVSVFKLSSDPAVAMPTTDGPVTEINMNASINSSPVFANGVLYIATRTHLFAIRDPNVPADDPVQDSKRNSERDRDQIGHSARSTAANVHGRVPKPIFAPTPQDVVEAMLDAVAIEPTDTVIDLGSGDGRIVITAAKEYGAEAVGYEIDRELVRTSRERIGQAGLSTLAQVKQQDMYTANLGEARVVTVFLYPVVLEKLKPQFAKMKPGSWIVSHHYEIPDEVPTRVVTVESQETGDTHRVFVYSVPLLDG